jgi:hypothetical protein
MAILNLCRFFGLQNVFRKMEKGVGWSTRRVLPWHKEITEYLEGTAEELGFGHV